MSSSWFYLIFSYAFAFEFGYHPSLIEKKTRVEVFTCWLESLVSIWTEIYAIPSNLLCFYQWYIVIYVCLFWFLSCARYAFFVSNMVLLLQPKIQDELIAREIVINDAEPSIRYKLTKRQTQEEVEFSFVLFAYWDDSVLAFIFLLSALP